MHVLRRVCLAAVALLFWPVNWTPASAQGQQAGISFDKRTWTAELSFDFPKYAEAISVNPTATFEFSVDDKGKVLGAVEIAGNKDRYRSVLDGSRAGSELVISATLQAAADFPSGDSRGNATLAQAADGQLAGSESEGPTNGHPSGPGRDVRTNGTPSPPSEGVASEAGPQAVPAPEPQSTIPQAPNPASCDIAGQWRMETDNVGQSTWTFTPAGSGSYSGQEQGLGSATGKAVMTGNAMRMEWRTAGGYSGLVELEFDAACNDGHGRHIFYTGRTGSESTLWSRIGASPAAAAIDTGGNADSDAVGPAPSPIRLHAVIGGKDMAAELTRTGPDSWEWVENGLTFRFRPLLDTKAQLVIYDRSRDMLHRLDLKTGKTAWQVGKLGGGDGSWNPHYAIVGR